MGRIKGTVIPPNAGKYTLGRPAGSPNKIGRTARENIIAVFDRIGGRGAMAMWARDNQTEFYKLYARLIPQNVHVEATIHDVTLGNAAVLAERLANHLASRDIDPAVGTDPPALTVQ